MDLTNQDQGVNQLTGVANATDATAIPHDQTIPPVQEEDDVIDKDWIEKAKQIIAANSGDPYKQSRQLAALKTEYLKKRYNKTINGGA